MDLGQIILGIFLLDVILMIYYTIMYKKHRDVISKNNFKSKKYVVSYVLFLVVSVIASIISSIFNKLEPTPTSLIILFVVITVTVIYGSIKVTIQSRK